MLRRQVHRIKSMHGQIYRISCINIKYSTVYYTGLTVKYAHHGRVRRSVSRDWQSARAHNTLNNTGLQGINREYG